MYPESHQVISHDITSVLYFRMEVAPSVPFHERAPDIMITDDIQGSKLEAEESMTKTHGMTRQLHVPRTVKSMWHHSISVPAAGWKQLPVSPFTKERQTS